MGRAENETGLSELRSSLHDYRAVVFDLDNTLTDTKRYPVRACKWLLSEAGVDPDRDIEPFLSILVREYFKGLEKVVTGGPYRDPYAIVRTAMGNASREFGLNVDECVLDEATMLFRALHVEVPELRDGVRQILTTLRGYGVRLGVVTNSFEGHIRPILSRIKIIDLFDAIVDPSMVRAYKPMPQPFESVMAILGTRPPDTLYIGDEFYADVVGAKRLGIDVVWLNHRGQSLDQHLEKHGPEYRPSLVVSEMVELLKLL